MQKYSKYKDSGVKWLGEIPSHWETLPGFAIFKENKEKNSDLRINTVLSLSYGKIIQKKDLNEGLVPAEYNTYQIVRPGNIIIRCTDLQNDKTSLRTGFVKNEGIITGAYLGLIVNKKYNSSYIHYFLHAWDITKEIYRYGSGLRQSLSWVDLKRLPILIPSYDEQNAIVSYLDSVTSKIDEAIAQQQKMIDLLNERKQIIINDAVTKGLDPKAKMKDSGIERIGRMPSHWNVSVFKHLFNTRTGITFTKEQLSESGAPVISYGQIHSKDNWGASVNPVLIRHIPLSLTKGKESAIARKGDFLFADTSEDFDGCGNNVYVDTEELIYAGYHTILAKCNNKECGQYLAYLFASSKWRGQVRSMVNGVKVYSVTQTILNNALVILPPISEQKEIANYVTKKVVVINEAIDRCKKRIKLLQERKQIIINDVVTGKVKVV